MSDLNAVSTRRGRDAIVAHRSRNLLRVDGETYTVAELAQQIGQPEEGIRRRASQLVRRRRPFTMEDFR